MAPPENNGEVEAKWGDKSIRLRGYDAIVLMSVGMAAIVIFFLIDMANEVKKSNGVVLVAVQQLINVSQRQYQAQVEATCVLTLDMTRRTMELGNPNSYCKRYSRGQE